MNVYPIILAGGGGLRLWPLSSPTQPKPFLDLFGTGSLFSATLTRLSGLAPDTNLRVVCGEDQRMPVKRALRHCGIEVNDHILVEPAGRNTGPAVLFAVKKVLAEDPEARCVVLPADHAIPDTAAFQDAIRVALRAADQDRIALLGVTPCRAETGYGYIEIESVATALEPAAVRRFVEKPDQATAETYLHSGRHFWNAGIFVFRAAVMDEEFRQRQPLLEAKVEAFLAGDTAAYSQCPKLSLDYAIMEHTRRATVVPVAFTWNDVGNWDAVHQLTPGDAQGNAISGDVLLDQCSRCYFRADRRTLVGIGLEDIVVVETPNEVLVAHKSQSQNLRGLAEKIQARGDDPRIEYRPWGSFRVLESGPGFKTKRLDLLPGGRTSLQKHNHRSEHWVVVAGRLKAICGDEIKMLDAGESIFIPVGTVHRLENPGEGTLSIIEVQTGSILAENDIVRFQDDYGRVKP